MNINIFIIIVVMINYLHSTPLEDALSRGDSCINVEWTPDSRNTDPNWYSVNGVKCSGSDTIYRRCDFISGNRYFSIAYSYGGEDPYDLFSDKIQQGYKAGSHLCHYQKIGDPTPYVAGTDCSGFVCYLWNFPRTSTSGLLNSTKLTQVSRNSIKAGDVLIKGGFHAVFVAEVIDNLHLLIWESTSAVNGCRERIIDLSDSYWDAYSARRNPSLVSSIYTPPQLSELSSDFKYDVSSSTLHFQNIDFKWNSVTIYNLKGARLQQFRYEARAAIQFNLPPGSYLLTIRTPYRTLTSPIISYNY